jgi:hypothetical protein
MVPERDSLSYRQHNYQVETKNEEWNSKAKKFTRPHPEELLCQGAQGDQLVYDSVYKKWITCTPSTKELQEGFFMLQSDHTTLAREILKRWIKINCSKT